MKNTAACFVAALLFLPAVASAQTMGHMPGVSGATGIKAGKGVGVITALDPKSAKVTIRHGPIPSVSWPAMTMAFKANPPTLLKGLHVGQTVAFDVRTKGMDAEVTAMQPR